MTPATSRFEIPSGLGTTSSITAWNVRAADVENGLLFSTPYAETAWPVGQFWGIGGLPSLVLAALFTAPIKLFDPEEEARRSGVYSVAVHQAARAAKRISLRQARLLALRVLADNEEGIRRDRLAEARLAASIWNDDQPS